MPEVNGAAGLLLAAGGGRRYGMPKALAAPHGVPMATAALAVLRAAGLDPRLIVVGAEAGRVRDLVRGDDPDVRVVDNPEWDTGMGSSLRAGLDACAADPAITAALILLVDTPGITAAAVARIAAGAGPGSLRAATYDGRQGHPVLIGRDHWAGVRSGADGDVGARPYLRAHRDALELVPCDDIADGGDLDTPPQPPGAGNGGDPAA